jgi:hypothetical protein
MARNEVGVDTLSGTATEVTQDLHCCVVALSNAKVKHHVLVSPAGSVCSRLAQASCIQNMSYKQAIKTCW